MQKESDDFVTDQLKFMKDNPNKKYIKKQKQNQLKPLHKD